jgi:hypothetical protein
VVPNPNNPQALNRYSYCYNNPLKYIDPTGHEVDINGINVAILDLPLQELIYCEGLLSLSDTLTSDPLFQTYDYFRGVEPIVAQTLEKSDTVYSIKYGTLPEGRVVQYSSDTHDLTLNKNEDFSFSGGVVSLAHEARHAYQGILLSNAPEGSWDRKKWNDLTYCEWDAHKFAGDLDDRLGWHEYWTPMNMSCYMQKLNLEVSYSDYYKAFNRLFSNWGSTIIRPYRNEFIKQGWVLTQNDYDR